MRGTSYGRARRVLEFESDLEFLVENQPGIVGTGTVLPFEAFDYLSTPLEDQFFHLVVRELLTIHIAPDRKGTAFLPPVTAHPLGSMPHYPLAALRTRSDAALCV